MPRAAGGRSSADAVRAAMAVRANQIGAGGAGITPALLDALVVALNADLVPGRTRARLARHRRPDRARRDRARAARRALRRGRSRSDARAARRARVHELERGHRRTRPRCSRSTRQRCSTPGSRSRRCRSRRSAPTRSCSTSGVHRGRGTPGPAAVAARMRALLDGRARRPRAARVQYPYPFRVAPQVDGVVHDALAALEREVDRRAQPRRRERARRRGRPRGAAERELRRGAARRGDRRASAARWRSRRR